MEIFENIYLWLLLSFFIMILTIGRKGYKVLNDYLDKKSLDIKNEYTDLQNLLTETNSLFNKKHQELEESKVYMSAAESKMQQHTDTEYEKLSEAINRSINTQKERLETYLNNKSLSNLQAMNNKLLEESIAVSLEQINKKLNKEKHKDLINQSINSIADKLSKK